MIKLFAKKKKKFTANRVFQIALRGSKGFFFIKDGTSMRNDLDHLTLLQCYSQHSGNNEHQLMKTSMVYWYIKDEVEEKIQQQRL